MNYAWHYLAECKYFAGLCALGFLLLLTAACGLIVFCAFTNYVMELIRNEDSGRGSE